MERNHTFYRTTGSFKTAAGPLISVLTAFLLYASAAQAQIKFPDGSMQTTAFGGTNNVASGTDATVGGGVDNVASGDQSTISGGSTNAAPGEASTIGGGFGNQALHIDTTVGGGSLNIAGAAQAVVSGGTLNTASGVSSVVAGGEDNIASAQNAVVGGGLLNETNNLNGTIAGGAMNLSSGDSSTIAGGYFNDANDLDATVGGGSENVASGLASTIPGGSQNIAAGDLSFATGFGATVEAAHNGTTLFADSRVFFFFSDRANEFAARATGGVRFVTAISGVTGEPLNGVRLSPGGGTWLNLSDKNSKENVRPVDTEAALEEVLALPINTWNYKTQDPTVRHMGPMAQDFYAAFGLGTDERHIGTVDADGAALAAIQGLHQRMVRQNETLFEELARKNSDIAALRHENALLSARLDSLEALILEATHTSGTSSEN